MKITEIRLWKIHSESIVKAKAKVTLDDELEVGGISVIQGQNGLFVSMPREKSQKDGKYYDTVHCKSQELREVISKAVLDKYNGNSDNVPAEENDELPF